VIPYPSNHDLWACRASTLLKQRVSIFWFAVCGQTLSLFELWILIPRTAFWLATPYYQSSRGHQRHIFIRPWASIPRLSLIQGQQCLNFDSRVNFGSSEFNSMHTLTLILNARILVAIYQFRWRMSNMKVSPQLATLDGSAFVSGALCRENFHTNGMKSCIDGRIECLTHYWAST
jgi:hypothetical protein